MHASSRAPQSRVASLLLVSVLALSACGGGGGGGGEGGAGSPAGTNASASSGGNGTPASGGAAGGTPDPNAGDTTYVVHDPNQQIVEQPGGGNDTVQTSVSFQLPANVENLIALEPSNAAVLTGNDLPNLIVGNPFREEDLYGLGGDDVLDGGGRIGGRLFGGEGNDRLVLSFGEMTGGPGADVFVAGGRGAMTSPDVPIVVRDFNAAEGDRIEIVSSQAHDAADLFARGILRFDAPTSRLILDFDPATTAPTSVDQVFVLQGVGAFDPAWVSFVPAAR